jgi:hypothetical protein
MKYWENDYAINKNSKDIVYKSVTGEVVTITKAQFLSENSDLTEEDFIRLKSFSDENYRVKCNIDNSETKHGRNYSESVGAENSAECVETCQEEDEALQNELSKLYAAMDSCLTETQKRRFRLHYFQKFTTRQIAAAEHANRASIQESLDAARKKIQKYFQKSHRNTHANPL